jgi:hypothetical protein
MLSSENRFSHLSAFGDFPPHSLQTPGYRWNLPSAIVAPNPSNTNQNTKETRGEGEGKLTMKPLDLQQEPVQPAPLESKLFHQLWKLLWRVDLGVVSELSSFDECWEKGVRATWGEGVRCKQG